MCGITGFYNQDISIEEGSRLCHQSVARLHHRGPDHLGTWTNEQGLYLGHARLSILDLSDAGTQPMNYGQITITYNGEIYNHQRLRRQLEDLGHRFIGHSDTETLVHAIDQWGIEPTLKKLEGMFALACYDHKEDCVYLARDRMGEKPLYYGVQNHNLVFASELKALKALPWLERRMNLHAVGCFFKYNYIPAPYSIFESIYKMKAAHFCRIDLGEVPRMHSSRRYWERSFSKIKRPISYLDAVAEVESRLIEVVKNQCLSDVSVGTFLSGGIDSSVITALLQKHSSQKVKSFSIGFKEAEFDESVHAQKVADYLQTDHTRITISSKDVLKMVDDVGKVFCEPFSDSSQLPMMLLSRVTKPYVSVVLSGDGGDELFAGYNRYIHLEKLYRRTWWLPQIMRRGFHSLAHSYQEEQWDTFFQTVSWCLAKTLRKRNFGHNLHKLANTLQHSSPDQMYDQLLSHWSSAQILKTDPGSDCSFKDLPNLAELSFVEQMMVTDSLTYLPDDIMVKVDRSTMASSLESRAPFLDHRLYEIVESLPLKYKLHGQVGKRLLRSILYNHVPESYFARPKQGFAVPLRDWLRSDLRDWAEYHLQPKRLYRHSWLNAEIILKMWDDHKSGQKNWSLHLWDVLMFQCWYDEWMTS